MPIETHVLVVGGGLAGLRLAGLLKRQHVDCHVIEARNRLGGRIETLPVKHNGRTGFFELGPSWFWPGQTRIDALIRKHNLSIIEQYSSGLSYFQDAAGAVHSGAGYASMQGSLRVDGGFHQVIAALENELSDNQITLAQPLVKFVKDQRVSAYTADGTLVAIAKHIVFAMPPRIVALFEFEPSLPIRAVQCFEAIPTWMAGQAKVTAVYEEPFWRERGYSGDAFSQSGPMAEMHDASDPSSGLGAIFGFIGVPHEHRADKTALKIAVKNQLFELYGEDAADPIELVIKDWAMDRHTATALDSQALTRHPNYGIPHEALKLWDSHLHLCSTEAATIFGGYLEGALESAEQLAVSLIGGAPS